MPTCGLCGLGAIQLKTCRKLPSPCLCSSTDYDPHHHSTHGTGLRFWLILLISPLGCFILENRDPLVLIYIPPVLHAAGTQLMLLRVLITLVRIYKIEDKINRWNGNIIILFQHPGGKNITLLNWLHYTESSLVIDYSYASFKIFLLKFLVKIKSSSLLVKLWL